MSLITATDLAKSFGDQDVFHSVSVALPHQARVALVGPNGVGKTTLLRLLVGHERPDQGQVFRARALRVGYLPQEASYAASAKDALRRSLWELGLDAFDELRRIESELAALEASMAEPERMEEAMARYGPLQEKFERAGGYNYPAQIRRVLTGLGFAPEDFERSLEQFSGGERTRALLGRLLLDDPDLLVLDEPTNHLDLEAVEWLEGWLRDWPGAALVVSHDRTFLDRTVDTIWELSPGGVETYRGNYTAYARQREERRSLQTRQHVRQREHIERELDYIRRNIAGQNSRQAKGRRKRLESLLRDGAIERPGRERSVSIRFASPRRSGDRVLETQGVVIGYPDSAEPLYEVPDLLLLRGECAAILGPNGAGKTTFLKTVLGELEPLAGGVRLGASLKPGYFAQAHEGLQPERTVLEEVRSVRPELKPDEARELLARFHFTGEALDKHVAVLSGGERGRLALAKLTLEGANFLLLDEPTNHLDLPSQEVLQQALAEFPGTILLVSHDRYLIDALATQVWEIDAHGSALQIFPRGYAEYAAARAAARQDAEEPPAEAPRPRRKARGKPERDGAGELGDLEARIDQLEEALDRAANELTAAGSDVEEVRRIGLHYARLEAELEGALARWERLARRESAP